MHSQTYISWQAAASVNRKMARSVPLAFCVRVIDTDEAWMRGLIGGEADAACALILIATQALVRWCNRSVAVRSRLPLPEFCALATQRLLTKLRQPFVEEVCQRQRHPTGHK